LLIEMGSSRDMSSFLVDKCNKRVIGIATKAMRPVVVKGNAFTDGIMSSDAWLGLLRDGSMGTMIGSSACSELAKMLTIPMLMVVLK
jgi:hypothetical protein